VTKGGAPLYASGGGASLLTAPITLDDLRRFAVTRSLFAPTTLRRAIDRLGFVQADPIRAPARAQDLTLRHRVAGYRTGDLDRRYVALGLEEDVFINYGFLTAPVHALMFPRALMAGWPASRKRRAEALLAFVRERGVAHPREVDAEFAHGRTTNYWGGSSKATTYLLEHMHYAGLLRVARRAGGIRLYATREQPVDRVDPSTRDRQIDALVDVVVGKYAPLPAFSLSLVIARLRYAVPQWHRAIKAAQKRAKARLPHARVDGIDWYWPSGERLPDEPAPDAVRFLAPFDPVVWDRRRLELLWGWAYRFEAYTPAAKRKLGYYALPMLWRDRVIGWANVSTRDGKLATAFGYVNGGPPRERAFVRELEAEVERMRRFLSAEGGD
jgi:uncharacterized protein YcaQ